MHSLSLRRRNDSNEKSVACKDTVRCSRLTPISWSLGTTPLHSTRTRATHALLRPATATPENVRRLRAEPRTYAALALISLFPFLPSWLLLPARSAPPPLAFAGTSAPLKSSLFLFVFFLAQFAAVPAPRPSGPRYLAPESRSVPTRVLPIRCQIQVDR